jgi:molybdopterin/thiamine biosynthesis adenylyltransferase
MPDKASSATLVAQTPGTALRANALARRAERLPRFIGLAPQAPERLDHFSVLVVGTGSVGATIALSLARLQVREIRLVDRGAFKPESLLTQPVGVDSLGQPKASHIAALCREFSPTRVVAHDCALQELALTDMLGVDLVVLAGDNLTVARDTGQRCLHLGLPLMAVAVHGETLTAQCRFHNTARPQGSCPVCLFSPLEFRMLDEERVWSCEGTGRAAAPSEGRPLQPTLSVRSLCGLAGEMGALLATRWALRLGSPPADTMTEICAYTWRTFVTPLRHNPRCPCRHERWQVRPAPRAMADCTVAELLHARGAASARRSHDLSLALREYNWVERGLCACPDPQPVQRFVRLGSPARAQCPRCRRPVHPQPFYSHETVPCSLLKDAMNRPLRDLGAREVRDVTLHDRGRTTLFINPNDPSRTP